MKEVIVSPGGMKKLREDVEQHRADMAIVANGNTHAAIGAGQFVDVKSHPTLADGVYRNKLTIAIEADAALSTENMERMSSGALNALKAEVEAVLDTKQDALTIDSALNSTSTNPVQNSVIKSALDTKQDALTFDNAPTSGSNNPVKSGGIYSKIGNVGDVDLQSQITSLSNKVSNVINPGGLSNNERYLAGNLGTVNASNIEDFVSSYGLSTGNFKDIYPGCYIQIPDSVANTTWMVGGLDIKHNSGGTAMGHGAEFIPRNAGFAYGTKMNDVDTTEGGYNSSAMKSYLDSTLTPALQTVLGSHLLQQSVVITKSVDTTKEAMYSAFSGMASDWAVTYAYAVLMSEVEVYGSMIWGGPFDIGEARTKLPVFNFISPVEFDRGAFWLRAVVSNTAFAFCGNIGQASYAGASSGGLYVRPLIRIG